MYLRSTRGRSSEYTTTVIPQNAREHRENFPTRRATVSTSRSLIASRRDSHSFSRFPFTRSSSSRCTLLVVIDVSSRPPTPPLNPTTFLPLLSGTLPLPRHPVSTPSRYSLDLSSCCGLVGRYHYNVNSGHYSNTTQYYEDFM